MGGRKANTIEKFWRCVGKGDGCWMFGGALTKDGYGKFKLNGKHMRAPRIAYEATKGPIPEGMVVMHKCDTPRCCNPDHLTVGTTKDNVQDAFAKGRRGFGERSTNAKLTNKEAGYVKHLYFAERQTMKALAEFFKVSTHVINQIVHGRTYRSALCRAAI